MEMILIASRITTKAQRQKQAADKGPAHDKNRIEEDDDGDADGDDDHDNGDGDGTGNGNPNGNGHAELRRLYICKRQSNKDTDPRNVWDADGLAARKKPKNDTDIYRI